MKRLWWLIAVAAFMLMLYTCALPGDLAVGVRGEGLSGTYTVNGVDPTGLEYSGTLVIADRSDSDRYDLEWIITGSILNGSGRVVGDVFEVDWATTNAAGSGQGTARYDIRSDGSLIGERLVEGLDGVGTEEIFPEP